MINIVDLKRKAIDAFLINQPSISEKTFKTIARIYTGESTNSDEKAKYSIKIPSCYPYVSTKDISMKGLVNYENGMYIPKGIDKFSIAPENAILLCIEGGNAGNKIAIINQEVCFVNKLCCFDIFGADNRYIYYYLLSNKFRNNFKEQMTGLIGGVSVKKLKELLIPIPKPEEQKRIADRLDEIFAELDKIDEKQTKLQSIQDKMESKILKLAIQGKLVEQRQEEGTAEELFEKIQNEKQQLIKQGKIKKEKPLPPIEESEIPFEIPSTWKWVRIGDIFNHSAGKSLNASDTEGKKYTYITTSNVYWNRFILDELKTMFYKDNELDKCSAKKGDLLVLEGGDIGRAAIWNYDYDMRIQNHIHRLRPLNGVDVRFFYYLFFLYKTYNLIDGRGIGLQGLSANKLKSIVMPLPPYEEQKRIVAKIEELLPLCRIIEDE